MGPATFWRTSEEEADEDEEDEPPSEYSRPNTFKMRTT